MDSKYELGTTSRNSQSRKKTNTKSPFSISIGTKTKKVTTRFITNANKNSNNLDKIPRLLDNLERMNKNIINWFDNTQNTSIINNFTLAGDISETIIRSHQTIINKSLDDIKFLQNQISRLPIPFFSDDDVKLLVSNCLNIYQIAADSYDTISEIISNINHMGKLES